MAAKIYHLTLGEDGWQVEIVDEDLPQGSDEREEPVVLGAGWIGAEPGVIHKTVVAQRPDGSLAAEYSARKILRRKVSGRRRRRH